jgi:hypothetical protein
MTSGFVILGILIAFFAFARLWALTANAEVDRYVDQELRKFLVGASVHIYKGALVGTDPAGYLKAFVPGDVFRGIAYEECDNTIGAATAGAKSCRVFQVGDFSYTLTSAAQSDCGKPAFATADNAIALTGHPDAYVGRIVCYVSANLVIVRLKALGEKPPNGVGSVEQTLVGNEIWTTTGATAGTVNLGNGFEAKSILGPGIAPVGGEDAAINLVFDATAEVALASIRAPLANLPVDKGITMDFDFVASDSGDHAALDIDIGLGTALTVNSEADIDHADMAQLAAFHIDGASDNILAQSDNATTDVAAVDTTIDNDSATDVPTHGKIIVRPAGTVEFWIAGARVLATTVFAVLSTSVLAPFVNVEKTSNDTTCTVTVRNLRVAGGCAA